VARAYSRQTDRSSEIVRLVGYVAGGLPGKRLLSRLAIATSADTILRRVKQPPSISAEHVPVRHLGVDDWAWRKGQDYGTILVDLDLHRVMDLLPDGSSESFADWLQRHPEVVTIARDRCGLYAEGGALGAPDAQQVADRFHLILNLSCSVERVLEERSRQLVLSPEEDCIQAQSVGVAEPADNSQTLQATRSQQRRQRRLEKYQKVADLSCQGYSQKRISRELGMSRKTIRRWLRAGQFPERKPTVRRQPAKVQQFADYLHQRWEEGCHNATRLYQEIREKGYRGKRSMVAQFVSRWRKTGKSQPGKLYERIAPRHAAILVTRAAGRLSDQQQELLQRIAVQCPDVIALRRLALGFREALAHDNCSKLDPWIERTKRCEFGLWSALLTDCRKISARSVLPSKPDGARVRSKGRSTG
jgi:transposase